MSDIVLTPEGHQKVLKELEQLKEKRKSISERIQEAKELGDLSENAEYHEAKNDQAFVEGRIVELEEMLHNAQIASRPLGSSIVQVGSTVTIQGDGKKLTFTIVGINEANPGEGKISNQSPLGKELLNRCKGDAVTIKTQKGEQKYRIESIS